MPRIFICVLEDRFNIYSWSHVKKDFIQRYWYQFVVKYLTNIQFFTLEKQKTNSKFKSNMCVCVFVRERESKREREMEFKM